MNIDVALQIIVQLIASVFLIFDLFPFALIFFSTFDRGDEQNSFETNGASVVVVGSAGSHDHGSSKIKLKSIVDYKWEVKNYIGRLIAVHLEGKYVAYAIKGNIVKLDIFFLKKIRY